VPESHPYLDDVRDRPAKETLPTPQACRKDSSPTSVSAESLLHAFDRRDYDVLLTDFACLLPHETRQVGHPLHSVTQTLEFYLHLYAVVGHMQGASSQLESTLAMEWYNK
jgi:hypothetical protein